MFKIIKVDLIKWFILCGITLSIDILWKILETIEYGKPMPSVSDSIIAIILALSLYKNLNISVHNGQDAEKALGGGDIDKG